VHRATLPDGTQVAVKVQYLDVAASIRADLANASLLVRAVRLAVPGVDAEGVASEVRARISEELDYRAEARWQATFAARFAGHPFVAVPAVVPSHSAARVLTTTWAEGRDFAEALRDPAEVRSAHGEILFRFLLGNVLGEGELPADPHPGNYRFDARGERTVFLDFGCVKVIPPGVQGGLRQLFRAGLDGDPAGERQAAEHLGLVARAGGAGPVAGAVGRLCVPYRRDATEPFAAPFTSSSLHAAAGAGLSQVRRELRIPGELPFLNRTVVGMYAVLARLGASANWHRIAREYACGDPPATPLGELEQRWRAARRSAAPAGLP
jgi:predicted unusual protein kinase regulating ubiquinone biosynthesis (AarF/ABC1/UbiB family)